MGGSYVDVTERMRINDDLTVPCEQVQMWFSVKKSWQALLHIASQSFNQVHLEMRLNL